MSVPNQPRAYRYDEAEKSKLIEECLKSGLSVYAFCKRIGINNSTLANWMKERGLNDPSRSNRSGPGSPEGTT